MARLDDEVDDYRKHDCGNEAGYLEKEGKHLFAVEIRHTCCYAAVVGLSRHELVAHRRVEDYLREPGHGGLDTSVIVALAEIRIHVLADDASGYDVGHRALHSVAGAYLHFPVIAGHQQEQSVVFVAFAYAPFLKQRGGKLFGCHRGIYAVDGHHDKFDRTLVPQVGNSPVETSFGLWREHS